MSVALPVAQSLSPYVTTLTQGFSAEVLRFFGLHDTPLPLCILERPRDGRAPWLLRVEHRDGPRKGLTLELFDSGSSAPAWMRTGPYALSYRRMPDGREPTQVPELKPFLETVRDRVKRLCSVPTPELEALQSALAGYLPWLGIEDEMLRQVSSGHAGKVATLRLGFRCNQNCSFCWQDRDWPEPDAEHYHRWLDEMAAQGVRSLSISGGEPTIHKEIVPVVEHARRLGMSVSLQTNAIRLRKPDFLKRLTDAGMSGVFVSYHSSDPDISDAMTRAPRTHQPTVEGIEACLAAGLDVRLNCVVERLNFQQIPEHARHIAERFVKPYARPVAEVTYTFPSAYWDPAEWRKAIVPIDELRPYLIEAVQTLIAVGVEVQATGTCGFPPCVLTGVDEAMRFLPPEAVDRLDASGRRFGKVCSECVMQSRCLGVRHEYQTVHGERGLVPFRTAPNIKANAFVSNARIDVG
jgi:sulfatase maturation enzyme AslB (radical SAM superfamily)